MEVLWLHSQGNKSNYVSSQIWEQPVFSWELAKMVKTISVGLETLEFHPENINNIFNRFIDHIHVGTMLFVQFHNNLLNLQMLRSFEPINWMRADFRLHRKDPGSNCIVLYWILSCFPPQCQDMRTKCKCFLFISIIRVTVKLYKMYEREDKSEKNKINKITFHFQLYSTLHLIEVIICHTKKSSSSSSTPPLWTPHQENQFESNHSRDCYILARHSQSYHSDKNLLYDWFVCITVSTHPQCRKHGSHQIIQCFPELIALNVLDSQQTMLSLHCGQELQIKDF